MEEVLNQGMSGSGGRKRQPRWAPAGGGEGLQDSSPVADGEDKEVAGEGRCYRVTFETGIGIRDSPSVSAYRTGRDLVKGEVFEVKTEIRREGRRFFELMDGRGWVFDWSEVDGERVDLVEIAAQLYTVAFPDGVNGVKWGSDTTMRFCSVRDFNSDGDAADLSSAGMRADDILVMIDQDPVVGMPFGKVLERVWATAGRQPGGGIFYKVVTEGPYGIGVRDEPDMDSPRTGQDLIRGTIFQVDEVLEPEEGEEGPTFLRLADGSGWAFDLNDSNTPTVMNLKDAEPGCTLTMWRGDAEELSQTIGLKFKQDGEGKPFTITVLEEGQPVQRIPAGPGTNLRKVLIDNGFQVYQELRSVFNCNSRQLCGTCVLDVVDGMENLTVKAVNEKKAMAANPDSFRLSCNIDVYGDVCVRLRPKGVKYGGGTS